MTSTSTFVTGCTGFVGGELLARLLSSRTDLIALVRASDQAHARARGEESLTWVLGRAPTESERARVRWVAGDMQLPRFGLEEARWSALAAEVNEVFHCAASTRFDLSLSESHQINVVGLEEVYRLSARAMEQGGFRRLHHMSTAYVAGLAGEEVQASYLPPDDAACFRNSYEQSKARAERLLRDQTQVPFTVYRPSIVVGDSRTGRTRSWNVCYVPMRLMAHGHLPFMPHAGRALVDLIPVDYVVDGLLALAEREDTVGETYHLTAGEDALTIAGLVEMVYQGLARRDRTPLRVKTRLVGHWQWQALEMAASLRSERTRRAAQHFRPYLQYTGVQTCFDNQGTRAVLDETGPAIARVADSFPRAVDYALAVNFGRDKRPPPRGGSPMRKGFASDVIAALNHVPGLRRVVRRLDSMGRLPQRMGSAPAPGRERYYIGMSTTLHDPALAIVDSSGELLFAEATERHRQYKRGLNCEPDDIYRVAELVRRYCDPDAEYVVASNWLKMRPWVEVKSILLGEARPESLLALTNGEYRRDYLLEGYKIFYQLALFQSAFVKRGVSFAQCMRSEFNNTDVHFRHYWHHMCHAQVACHGAPFDEASCMIVDSYGTNGSIAYFTWRGGQLETVHRVMGLSSLGFLYMRLTELCGFSWIRGEEWKVMGLAPYGQLDPEIYETLRGILLVDGLDIRTCGIAERSRLMRRLDARARRPGEDIYAAADMAYTGQAFFADVMTALLTELHARFPSDNLVLSGGCALNSSYNGQILQRTPFRRLHVPSAPGDDGTAIGAALMAWQEDHDGEPRRLQESSPYLGSEFSDASVEQMLRLSDLPWVKLSPEELCRQTAALLAEGKLVGWVQGRAEFGPRALGHRSILADPRSAEMKATINSRVKFREEFRPFAPSILHEYGDAYFEHYQPSRYMERTLTFRPEVREKVPAVVHVNGTGRLQTVKQDWDPRFHALLTEFHRVSGVPVLLNTSLNIMGKPIVHSVEDALAMFFTTGLDALVIGDHLLHKRR